MHIGFLTPEFPHPKVTRSAGIGTSILNLSTGLVKLGHKVTIIVYGQSKDEVIEENGLVIRLVDNVKFKGLSLWLTQRKLQKIINKLVEKEQLEIVEAPDWTGISANIHPNCPVVIKLHGSDTYFCDLEKRAIKPKNFRRERIALQNADAIASVSKFTANETQRLFGIDKQIAIVPNGIDLERFPSSGQVQPKPNVLYFGTLIRKKGALELPLIFNEVVKLFPDATLTLVGKDSADAKTGNLSTWALMQPLFSPDALSKTQNLGAVAYSEMRDHIEKAAVCVFPTFAEALPVSWLEAMAMGKSVVASNIGWAVEIVADGNDGFLAHPANHKAFAKKVVALLSDEALRSSIGQNARTKVRDSFSNEIVAKRSEAFYKTVIDRK